MELPDCVKSFLKGTLRISEQSCSQPKYLHLKAWKSCTAEIMCTSNCHYVLRISQNADSSLTEIILRDGRYCRVNAATGTGSGTGSGTVFIKMKCGRNIQMKDCPNTANFVKTLNDVIHGFRFSCYACGKNGHIAINCPEKSTATGFTQNQKQWPCYRCGDRNHIARDCRQHANYSGHGLNSDRRSSTSGSGGRDRDGDFRSPLQGGIYGHNKETLKRGEMDHMTRERHRSPRLYYCGESFSSERSRSRSGSRGGNRNGDLRSPVQGDNDSHNKENATPRRSHSSSSDRRSSRNCRSRSRSDRSSSISDCSSSRNEPRSSRMNCSASRSRSSSRDSRSSRNCRSRSRSARSSSISDCSSSRNKHRSSRMNCSASRSRRISSRECSSSRNCRSRSRSDCSSSRSSSSSSNDHSSSRNYHRSSCSDRSQSRNGRHTSRYNRCNARYDPGASSEITSEGNDSESDFRGKKLTGKESEVSGRDITGNKNARDGDTITSITPARASLASELENRVTCLVCLEIYKDPFELACPCRSTLCGKCVNSLDNNGEIQCPTCRTTTQRAEAKKDFKINDFVELYKLKVVNASSEKQIEQKEVCDVCEDKNPITAKCEDCSYKMCAACTKAHAKFKETQKHSVIELGVFVQKIKDDLTKTLNMLKNKNEIIQSNMVVVDTRIADFENQEKSQLKQVDLYINHLKASIDEHAKLLKKTVTDSNDVVRQRFNIRKNSITVYENDIKNKMLLVTDMNDKAESSGFNEEIKTANESIQKDLEKIKRLKVFKRQPAVTVEDGRKWDSSTGPRVIVDNNLLQNRDLQTS